MKKLLLLFVIASLFILVQGSTQVRTPNSQKISEIKATITRIEAEVSRLKKKLQTTTVYDKRLQIIDVLDGHYARIKKLNDELEQLGASSAPEPVAEPAPAVSEPDLGALVAEQADETAKTREQIKKIEAEIKRLQGKLGLAGTAAKKRQLVLMVEAQEARLAKLQKELITLEKAKVEETKMLEEVLKESPEFVETVPEEASEEVYIPITVESEVRPAQGLQVPVLGGLKFEIGAQAGFYSGSTSALGELRFKLPYIFGPATTTLRLAGGLAQSRDTSRRYAPVMLDGIFNFPAGWFSGVENYVGAGLNYVVLTSGMKPGTIGGQVFYGVESNGFLGKLYGEMGWGILRTGFSPSHRGTTITVGYRKEWGS